MNDTLRLTAPCHFGMEAVLKREIYDLGYDIDSVDNGRVTFIGDGEAIARSNIWLRTTERVLLNVGEFKAFTFEELFDFVYCIEWEKYLPVDAAFPVVKANSISSKLFSTRDIQAITKKAIAERLKKIYKKEWLDENGGEYPIRVNVIKDIFLIGIDTSGTSLHKRGYRPKSGKAPIAETLASAIILLTPWKKDRILIDPFCGSGTFVIEAAMIAAGIAPGVNREFTSMSWENLISKKDWYEIIEEARENENIFINTDIQGYDIDGSVLNTARESAKNAGVDKLIHFQQREVKELSHSKKFGFIITNPPYGERMGEKDELFNTYKELGSCFSQLDSWSAYLITSYDKTEKAFGRKASKKRKLYNGMLKTDLYSFEGPKPPKKDSRD